MHFTWLAQYRDGTSLAQKRDDGTENKYDDIDREHLGVFAILDEHGHHVFSLHIPDGGRLIYRRRSIITPGQGTRIIWIVGVQKTNRGVNSQTVVVLNEDGNIHILDNFKSFAPINPPQPYEQDREGWVYEDIPS